jgi:hypothetical protein
MKNIRITAKENLGYYELKQHRARIGAERVKRSYFEDSF